MALNIAVEWDVRTTGNDGNGGGFVAGATGTDYSKQDSAQKSSNDLHMHGTTNTKCHPNAAGVAAEDVGNIVNITAGTDWTPGRYEIVSQDGTDWTLDRSPSAAGNANLGTYAMGGALLTIGSAAAAAVTFNTVHVKAGTYTLTTTVTPTMGSGVWIGYQTTHRDMGTRPLITTATDSTVLINTSGSAGGTIQGVNISFSNTAAVRANGIQASRGDVSGLFYRCLFDGFERAFYVNGGGCWVPLMLEETEVKNCTSDGVWVRDPIVAINNYIHDNGANGVYLNGVNYGAPVFQFSGNIFANNTGDGIYQAISDVSAYKYFFHRNTFAGNCGDGIQTGAGGGGLTAPPFVELVNNIFYDNGAYGVNNPVAPLNGYLNRCNAYGANGTAAVLNMPAGTGDVTLTADPFTNAAAGDYSLNNTAGGGAACKGAGFQWGE